MITLQSNRRVVAGLVPATPTGEAQRFNNECTTRQYYLYILASRPGGAVCVGVTNDLVRRVYEHKMKLVHGHTKRYQIDQLAYLEVYDSPSTAIQREKNTKHWPRVWKTRLIGEMKSDLARSVRRDRFSMNVGPQHQNYRGGRDKTGHDRLGDP